MALRSLVNSKNILYVSFNQDYTCVSLGTQHGIIIYNLDSHKCVYKFPIGAVSIAEMLFCTSLVAYVGAGEQPALTPRKLSLINTSTNRVIQDLSFTTSVLSVHMNKLRLVAIVDRKASVYDIKSLLLLRTLEMADNTHGCAALSSCNEPNLLALPASSSDGTLRIYDTMSDGGNVLCEMCAHKTPLQVMAWNHDATLLASASQKGTVIRVHRMPAATKAYTFRRGTYPATIHSLAFSPAGMEPPLLAATSSHGTVHLFRLEPPERHSSSTSVAASAAAGLLAAVMRYSVADMVEPPRSIANIKLPVEGVASTCAVLPHRQQQQQMGTSTSGNTGYETGAVVILVATLEGLLYEYSITDLYSQGGPKCALEGEWALLGTVGT